MIPTRHKSKLSRTLSYPIGAEAVTTALEGAPHVESLTLGFYALRRSRLAEIRQHAPQRQQFVVLSAEYMPATRPGFIGANYMLERGWYDAKWQVTVYAVAREVRHLASDLLREHGLPALVEWLRSSRSPGWENHRQTIELFLNPGEGTLAARTSTGV
jgi:hypothetical protein